jgi:hypothetical protein
MSSLGIQLVVDTSPIPFFGTPSFTKVYPFPSPLSGGIFADIVEADLIGKTGTATLKIAPTPDNTLSETLEVTDTLGLGIPAVLASFTAKQSLSSFEEGIVTAVDPNGVTLAATWEIVESA